MEIKFGRIIDTSCSVVKLYLHSTHCDYRVMKTCPHYLGETQEVKAMALVINRTVQSSRKILCCIKLPRFFTNKGIDFEPKLKKVIIHCIKASSQ